MGLANKEGIFVSLVVPAILVNVASTGHVSFNVENTRTCFEYHYRSLDNGL